MLGSTPTEERPKPPPSLVAQLVIIALGCAIVVAYSIVLIVVPPAPVSRSDALAIPAALLSVGMFAPVIVLIIALIRSRSASFVEAISWVAWIGVGIVMFAWVTNLGEEIVEDRIDWTADWRFWLGFTSICFALAMYASFLALSLRRWSRVLREQGKPIQSVTH